MKRRENRALRRLQRQYSYFCTSKASNLSTCGARRARAWRVGHDDGNVGGDGPAAQEDQVDHEPRQHVAHEHVVDGEEEPSNAPDTSAYVSIRQHSS